MVGMGLGSVWAGSRSSGYDEGQADVGGVNSKTTLLGGLFWGEFKRSARGAPLQEDWHQAAGITEAGTMD